MERRLSGVMTRFLQAVLLVATVAVAQYNQRIPFLTCELAADTSVCFTPDGGTTYRVPASVATLGDLFRLCLQADTSRAGGDAIRVILAIDRSGSMCDEYNGVLPNDVTDRRIAAAHQFLDSLADRSPGSELGVVQFRTSCRVTAAQAPLALNSAANLATLHAAISAARCGATDPYYKELRIADTYQGCATDTSWDVLMEDYSASDPRERHLILLTDDGWRVASDRVPSEIMASFRANYPGISFPITHAVYMSRDGSITYDQNLRMIADSTGGMFIPNATPADIVQKFMDILAQIVAPRAEALYVMTVTNMTTGQQQEAVITRTSGPNDYLIRAMDWPLAYGTNSFRFDKVYQTVDGRTLSVERDTLTVERLSSGGGTSSTVFDTLCRFDSTDIVITAAPTPAEVNTQVNVRARIQSDRAARFAPGEATVRAFTRFTAGENGSRALYHLDGGLVDAEGNANGTGNASVSSSSGAFGGCLASGTFNATLFAAAQSVPEFTFESWVRPGLSNPSATIVNGGQFSFTIDPAGRLRFTAGSATITSTAPLARDVWQHVAVVRQAGNGMLFVNGLIAASTGTVPQVSLGAITVGPPGTGRIDEVRLSTVSRVFTASGAGQTPVPVLGGVTWTMAAGTATGASAALPTAQWIAPTAGTAAFSLSSSTPAEIIVNMLHTEAGALWSVNSNPVRIFSNTVTNAVPARALVRDTDGNGFLDRIDIVVADTVRLADSLPTAAQIVSALSITPVGGVEISLVASSVQRTSDTSFAIVLSQHGSGPMETGWDSARVSLSALPLTADGMPITVARIEDRAGPVVARAVYSAGAGNIDTLHVTISEPVVWRNLTGATPEGVYVYVDGDVVSTEAFNGLDADNLDSVSADRNVVVMDNGFAVTPLKDSLALEAVSAYLVDRAGNPPPSNGRRAPIEWSGNGSVTVAAGPNPFVPGKTPLPEGVIRFYPSVIPSGVTSGIVVGVTSTKPLQPAGTDPVSGAQTYGKADIFDAVGNLVRGSLPLKLAQGYQDYGVFWDGYNSRNRAAGGGTYLMVLRMKDVDGKVITERYKIGIKHDR